jgi:uncharacterized membrane protein
VLAGSYVRATDSLSAFSPKERVAMKRLTRLKVGPVAVLLLLALLTYLAVHRRVLTTEEAEGEAVGAVVTLEDTVDRDKYVAVSIVALVALLGFVAWTALRAKEGADKELPRAGEPSASDKAAPR